MILFGFEIRRVPKPELPKKPFPLTMEDWVRSKGVIRPSLSLKLDYSGTKIECGLSCRHKDNYIQGDDGLGSTVEEAFEQGVVVIERHIGQGWRPEVEKKDEN